MNITDLFPDELNGIGTDFKAEVIAAEMIENNTHADKILIVPLGAMNRPQSKDIRSVTKEVSGYDNKEYILIQTNKEGLYDKLPEGLFHTYIPYSADKNEKRVTEGIKQHRIEEKVARTFFLPFDVALFDARVQIALYEYQLDKKFHNNHLINIFKPHWQIFQYLNVLQSNIFLQFLPLIHIIRDDWQAIETLFELLFLTPAKLLMQNQARQNKTDKNSVVHSAKSDNLLGFDIILGDAAEGAGFAEIEVTFGPMSAEGVKNFTVEQQQEKIVQLLCDYLLPADMDVVIKYDFIESDRSFILPEEGKTSNNCTIGVSSFL